jgi:hypothetical protein
MTIKRGASIAKDNRRRVGLRSYALPVQVSSIDFADLRSGAARTMAAGAAFFVGELLPTFYGLDNIAAHD